MLLRCITAKRVTATGPDKKELFKLGRIRRTLPPIAAIAQTWVAVIVIQHLAPEGLVLGPLHTKPRPIRKAFRKSIVNLGVAEREQLVGGRRHGAGWVGNSTVVERDLGDGLYLGLEVGRHEVPYLAGVHLLAQLGSLPPTVAGILGVHAGFNPR